MARYKPNLNFPGKEKDPIDYYNVPIKYTPDGNYKLVRSSLYDNNDLPSIGFFGITKDDIGSYVLKNGTMSYYYWDIPIKEFETNYGLIINLYSDYAQSILKSLSAKEDKIVKKALKLGDKDNFTDKYIRVSESKKDDIAAFELLKGKFHGYIGSYSPGKDSNPVKNTLELSHNEIVIWDKDKLNLLNTVGKLKGFVNSINNVPSSYNSGSNSGSNSRSNSSSSSNTRKRKTRKRKSGTPGTPRTPGPPRYSKRGKVGGKRTNKRGK